MLQRMKIGLGIAALGMTMALVPALSASASVASLDSVTSVKSESSIHLLSSFCSDYKADTKAAAAAQGPAFTRAVESGKWPAIQKALLTSYNGESGALNKMVASLSSAPSNVKAAVSTVIKFDGSLKGIIQKSKSMTQFESSITSLEKSPKFTAAVKLLDNYTAKQCPGLITTTT